MKLRKRNVKSRIIRIRISEALYQRLMDHAERSRRSVSEIVRHAIRAWIKEIEHGESESINEIIR